MHNLNVRPREVPTGMPAPGTAGQQALNKPQRVLIRRFQERMVWWKMFDDRWVLPIQYLDEEPPEKTADVAAGLGGAPRARVARHHTRGKRACVVSIFSPHLRKAGGTANPSPVYAYIRRIYGTPYTVYGRSGPGAEAEPLGFRRARDPSL